MPPRKPEDSAGAHRAFPFVFQRAGRRGRHASPPRAVAATRRPRPVIPAREQDQPPLHRDPGRRGRRDSRCRHPAAPRRTVVRRSAARTVPGGAQPPGQPVPTPLGRRHGRVLRDGGRRPGSERRGRAGPGPQRHRLGGRPRPDHAHRAALPRRRDGRHAVRRRGRGHGSDRTRPADCRAAHFAGGGADAAAARRDAAAVTRRVDHRPVVARPPRQLHAGALLRHGAGALRRPDGRRGADQRRLVARDDGGRAVRPRREPARRRHALRGALHRRCRRRRCRAPARRAVPGGATAAALRAARRTAHRARAGVLRAPRRAPRARGLGRLPGGRGGAGAGRRAGGLQRVPRRGHRAVVAARGRGHPRHLPPDGGPPRRGRQHPPAGGGRRARRRGRARGRGGPRLAAASAGD